MIDELTRLIRERLTDRRPFLVGITGPVSVGKTVLAEVLADRLPAEVLCTDVFLLPNAVLEDRGLAWRKGFPETFDVEALAEALAVLRGAGRVEVPVYSHAVYDVVPGAAELIVGDVIILEGVNALQDPAHGALDLSIYLHADEHVVREWFVTRFLGLRDEGRRDPTSFYAAMAGLDDDATRAIALATWDAVNGPNLRENILPTRARADLVVEKAPDHAIRRIVES